MADTKKQTETETDEARIARERDEAAKAEQKVADEKAKEYEANVKDETKGEDVKSVSPAAFDKGIGEHHVQTFANTPENPQLAPGLRPLGKDEKGTRLEITDSDHPDPLNPKVTYVHPDMVGDYLRTGWRYPVAG